MAQGKHGGVAGIEPSTLMTERGARRPQETKTRAAWLEKWRTRFKSLEAFRRAAGLPSKGEELPEAAKAFALRIPAYFASRMVQFDPHDPLLLQGLPSADEAHEVEGFSSDPLQEQPLLSSTPLLRKYAGRALWLLSASCALHCRYCFRRHLPYPDAGAGLDGLEGVLKCLEADLTVQELILSGGDPLSLPDDRLLHVIGGASRLLNLKVLRIHTRMPTLIPERITEALCQQLAASRLKIVMVTHINHAQELGPEARSALKRLAQANVTLLNQSVLLRGVNDRPSVLAELSWALFDSNVLPYYLHLLDRVSGTAHFEVPLKQAKDLMVALMAKLPGYLVPRLVREEPGAVSKVPVSLEEELRAESEDQLCSWGQSARI